MKLSNIIRLHVENDTCSRCTVRQRGVVLFNRIAIYIETLYSRGYTFRILSWHKV